MQLLKMVETQNLRVGYGSEAILGDLSFEVPSGRSLLVIGHNGAGKTTLLKTLFALQPTLGGSARLLGLDVQDSEPQTFIKGGVRFLGQGPRSFDELRIGVHRNAMEKLYRWPRSVGVNITSENASKKIGELSIGQRRIEALTLLQSGSPRLFLLDEPIAGLDVFHAAQVIEWITKVREQGVSFMVVEHNFRPLLELLEFTLVIRGKGASYFGPSRTLLDSNVLARYLL